MMMGCDFFAHAVSQCPRSRRLRGRPREASRTERCVRPKPRRLWGGLSGGLTPICIAPQEGPTLPGGGRPRQHPKGGTQDPHAHNAPHRNQSPRGWPAAARIMGYEARGDAAGEVRLWRRAGVRMRAAQKENCGKGNHAHHTRHALLGPVHCPGAGPGLRHAPHTNMYPRAHAERSGIRASKIHGTLPPLGGRKWCGSPVWAPTGTPSPLWRGHPWKARRRREEGGAGERERERVYADKEGCKGQPSTIETCDMNSVETERPMTVRDNCASSAAPPEPLP